MRLHRDERGQTIILVALSLPIILGFVGLATDVGSLYMDKREIQTAADAAAIAGALNLNYADYVAAGKAASSINGFTDGSSNVRVIMNDPPQWTRSNYYNKTGYVEATVTKVESTIFMSLFGQSTVTVAARAVATNQAPGSGCLYAVGTSGQTFTYNGGGNGGGGNYLNGPSCGLVVESDGTPAMVVHGNATVTLGSIGVVGTFSETGSSGTVTPTPIQNIAPESDPLNYLPQYSLSSTTTGHGSNATTTYSVSCATGYDCSADPAPSTCATNSGSTYTVAAGATLSPGCYVNLTFPSSGTVTLNPGLYLVNGNVNFGSGAVTGTGVTFYTNGTYNFGSGTYTLSAPQPATPGGTPPPYNGILFAESLTDSNGITFGGNSSTVIKGVVYAPDGSFTMSGNPSITLYADFVVHDLTLNGNISFTSYDALSGVSNPLTSIALVE